MLETESFESVEHFISLSSNYTTTSSANFTIAMHGGTDIAVDDVPHDTDRTALIAGPKIAIYGREVQIDYFKSDYLHRVPLSQAVDARQAASQ